MKTTFLAVAVAGLALAGLTVADAQQKIIQRIYTEVDVTDNGGLEGRVDMPLTHALAMSREFVDKENTYSYERCFRGALSEGNKAFKFEHLPVGDHSPPVPHEIVILGRRIPDRLGYILPVRQGPNSDVSGFVGEGGLVRSEEVCGPGGKGSPSVVAKS